MTFSTVAEVSHAKIIMGGRFGEESASISWRRLERFVELGGHYVDTAHSYAGGRSETVIGDWLEKNPGKLEIIDKIGHPNDLGTVDLRAASLRRELEISLLRLRIPTVAVLLLHRDSPGVPVGEIADTLADFVESGLCRQIGISNWTVARLRALTSELHQRGVTPVISYQKSLAIPMEPLWPGTLHADKEVSAVAREHELPLLAWAAQARGFFTGTTDFPSPERTDPFDNHDNRGRRYRCRIISETLGVRTEAVALAWLLEQDGVWGIIGPRSVSELEVSFTAAHLNFEPALLQWLERGK